jgi:hypothetical protein
MLSFTKYFEAKEEEKKKEKNPKACSICKTKFSNKPLHPDSKYSDRDTICSACAKDLYDDR